MNTQEIGKLNQLMKETHDKRLYERYLAVRLHLEGYTFTEISHLLRLVRQTISIYWHSYQEKGIDGLPLKHSPGKPCFLNEEQHEQLAYLLIHKQPADVGFEARYTWTLPLIAAWIKQEFGVEYSVRGVSKMLKRLGFSFTKATYTLAKADPEAQAAFKDVTFPELKRQLEDGTIDHLLFEDESMIRAYQALQYSWFPKGQQRKVKTYGRHEGAKLFGAINYETGQVHHREEEKADLTAWIRFLTQLLDVYSDGKIVMILDNSRIHHAADLQSFLHEHPRLKLVFLPPYSPELNLMEGVWKWLKSDVINNVFFNKFYRIRLHVTAFMNRINKYPQDTIDRLLIQL
ncbi:IS630 family transposase [Paenibacillus radicis (ex Xue et al. 2023)]|uniref:IS630 family transposase n=1 Tax=Paenibacillus radicis (ex Xue et al. 2023) TaxID=2972489 RepID=A0ABT1YVK9_9BACL|nr:IS630 family transposase [Paenibacillus radicis (ex Xue et al. 2023)]MCR8636976.1 IS630 family transposase [Paenibacillus radicis (ex Xue et al. 2023)]